MKHLADFRQLTALIKRLALLLPLLCLVACSSVKISLQDDDYVTKRRGDYINSGNLSQQTVSSLLVVGLDESTCKKDRKTCINTITSSQALNREQRLSSAAEIWLMDGMLRNKSSSGKLHLDGRKNEKTEAFSSYLEATRHAYAYLFYTDRSLSTRSLEARQHQVRDIYNFATYSSLQILSEMIQHCKTDELDDKARFKKLSLGKWKLEADFSGMIELEEKNSRVTAFTPDYQLNFKGINNQYDQDGLGARMVVSMSSPKEQDKTTAQPVKPSPVPEAETAPDQIPHHHGFLGKHRHHHKDKEAEKQPWEPMHYIAISALLKFPGNTLEEVLKTNRVIVSTYDTWQQHDVSIAGHDVPLAANYTAAYGMWLANSDFSSQSIGTLFGRGNILEEPRVYLMQPYQPNLKTLILVHGLASSPEAWVNAANEIMGDEDLRKHYQIWQIYYPTSAPLGINRHDIADAIERTFDHYDPQRKNPASHDAVIVGHSMGGILSRLLVSSSGNTLWEALNKYHPIEASKQETAKQQLGPYIFFEPLPEISRAIFIAAPHRGTPFADKSIARFIASLVKMPITVLQKAADITTAVFGAEKTERQNFNGVDNLSAKDPTIQAFATLQISPAVTYHSIMGNDTPDVPLAESSDGIVPYSSSHWDGAKSEVVIPSGHSVQETAAAIIEIRRILHEHLGTSADSLKMEGPKTAPKKAKQVYHHRKVR